VPIPYSLRQKMIRAPGATPAAFRAAYGLAPLAKLDWAKVNEICKHMADGFSKSAACGKAGVPIHALAQWEKDFPAVYEAIGQGRLRRLAKLEAMLLKDDQKMPQVVSAIFALKNADPDEWKENPQNGPVAPGLQQNITIITGVPETPARQTIEHEPQAALESVSTVEATVLEVTDARPVPETPGD